MKGPHIRQASSWLVLAVTLLACAIAPVATPTPQPLRPDMLGTIVAGTAAVAQTQTSILQPRTSTPTVTRTPSRTPTPATSTPTFVFFLPTFTPTITDTPPIPTLGPGGVLAVTFTPETGPGSFTGKEWTCGISEKTFLTVRPKEKFTLFVTFRNTGTKTWTNNGVDFVYTGGYRHEGRRIQDLPRTITPGNRITLHVDFIAPRGDTTSVIYDSFWSLQVGRRSFCGVKLSFEVEVK